MLNDAQPIAHVDDLLRPVAILTNVHKRHGLIFRTESDVFPNTLVHGSTYKARGSDVTFVVVLGDPPASVQSFYIDTALDLDSMRSYAASYACALLNCTVDVKGVSFKDAVESRYKDLTRCRHEQRECKTISTVTTTTGGDEEKVDMQPLPGFPPLPETQPTRCELCKVEPYPKVSWNTVDELLRRAFAPDVFYYYLHPMDYAPASAAS